ncbi:MAG: hypothetical protein ACJ795_13660 [Ktedonobacteraceae bacterium]
MGACWKSQATSQALLEHVLRYLSGHATFHDMPDFSGTITLDDPKREAAFWGDIGKVSASTFCLEILPRVSEGDLWISVVSEDTHIVVEFLEDIGILIQYI